MIHARDRVGAVLERHPALIDVLIEISPAFSRLRNPNMRRVMGRLVTIEEAARVARVDLDALLGKMNRAIGEEATGRVTPSGGDDRQTPGAPEDRSTSSAIENDVAIVTESPRTEPDLAEELVIDLDVREDLRSGREPFSRIMAAVATVPESGALRLRATFEPVPLYAVLARRGFSATSRENAEDDWTVLFRRGSAPAPVPERQTVVPAGAAQTLSGPIPGRKATDEGTSPGAEGGSSVVILDVRDLDPPEPLVRTLHALRSLPRGGTLVQLNQRVPQHLLPQLEGLGFTYEVREDTHGLVRTFIRHA